MCFGLIGGYVVWFCLFVVWLLSVFPWVNCLVCYCWFVFGLDGCVSLSVWVGPAVLWLCLVWFYLIVVLGFTG